MEEDKIREIVKWLKKDKPLPAFYKEILFPFGKKPKEYELFYVSKEREEDILAETMAMPLQRVKTFGHNGKEGWTNKLIFGDNIQALKTLLKDPDVKGKVKLVYIDPPFGTGDVYDAKGVPTYSAKLQGAAFIEFLRKRLILLRELLSRDGSIYVRIDYHFGHYIKCIMDEIFGKQNFRNEIVINRFKRVLRGLNQFNVATDSIFFYTKSENAIFNDIEKPRTCVFCGCKKEPQWRAMSSPGLRKPPERIIFGKKVFPPRGRHWTYTQDRIDKLMATNRIRINESITYTDINGKRIKGMPEYLQTESVIIDSNWTDLKGYVLGSRYPTENPEELLERVIKASSNRDDIVLDCFAGSGTTGAVAEKLGRRWIIGDCSKFAIYTMIKRMLTLKSKVGNKGKRIKPKPFTLYNAGLYDYDLVSQLGEKEYIKFALDLFQAEPRSVKIGGFNFEGTLFNRPVHVYLSEGKLTERYIDDLHKFVDNKTDRVFIIAPAGKIVPLEDYIIRDKTKYYFLRIPYSIIDEIHKTSFTRPIQPASVKDMNNPLESVGFDFVIPPEVECDYHKIKDPGKLVEEFVVNIKSFEPVQITKNPIEFSDMEALSMVMIDRNYNGKFFNLTNHFFRDEIENNDFKVKFPDDGIGEKIMIIYLDVLGNEKREVKRRSEFKKKIIRKRSKK